MTMTKNASLTKNAALVRDAELRRHKVLAKALATVQEGIALDDASGYLRAFGPWARELHYVNQHITVSQDVVDNAAKAYNDVAKHLVRKLKWPDEMIKVLPQGSASTKTLIRSPGNDKFDIDAVCQVDISRISALEPMKFFETIGDALLEFSATRKKRCWNLPCNGERFYLEFTPSVPLEKVPSHVLDSMAPLYRPSHEYIGTALAVVDTPSEKWKTSNPAGLTKWVDDTSKLQLVRKLSMEAADSMHKAAANVAPVPDQDVDISDTLRVAIRLFKRHRDMCVRRSKIAKEFQPISIIIVTLLTDCYAGLHDLGRTYSHPVQLLFELAELMREMVPQVDGEFRVDNPTVAGENFAERWNSDNGERHEAFLTWCDILAGDMRIILAAKNEQEIQSTIRDVFGCPPDSSQPNGTGGSGGTTTVHRPPTPAPATTGLA